MGHHQERCNNREGQQQYHVGWSIGPVHGQISVWLTATKYVEEAMWVEPQRATSDTHNGAYQNRPPIKRLKVKHICSLSTMLHA